MSPGPKDSPQRAAPMGDPTSDSEGVNVSAEQEGNGSTMVANNGYGKFAATVKRIVLDAKQKGNDSFMSANNAENGHTEAQIQKHNEGIEIRRQLQKPTGGQMLGGNGLAKLHLGKQNLSEHRAEVFAKMYSK